MVFIICAVNYSLVCSLEPKFMGNYPLFGENVFPIPALPLCINAQGNVLESFMNDPRVM
jgi:hypothetical protein